MIRGSELTEKINVEQLELKSFSKSIAEIEWLLLILVILYYVSPGVEILNPPGMVAAMVVFAGFTLCFHYMNFFSMPSQWKIAIETWAMIVFLTWALWNTGKVDSPLINLYILVLIVSALTLGRFITCLEFVLISAVYFYLDYYVLTGNKYLLSDFTHFMTRFAPFLLIAYVTTMLGADVKYGKDLFKQLSETDELTGLMNKRSFNMALLKEVKKSSRYFRPLSIALIDADNLKGVNDRLGHEAGDRLIRMLAAAIQQCMRGSDMIARYGGDEFIALMPETDCRHAREAGERIRQAVEHTSSDLNGHSIKTTVSIGIASYPGDAMDINELMDKADKALYLSKKTGRNRVTLVSSRDGQDVGPEDVTLVM